MGEVDPSPLRSSGRVESYLYYLKFENQDKQHCFQNTILSKLLYNIMKNK